VLAAFASIFSVTFIRHATQEEHDLARRREHISQKGTFQKASGTLDKTKTKTAASIARWKRKRY
jgi:hypothetical protein